MNTTIQIETLAAWGAPKEVRTKNGRRILRKAAPSDAFSAAWKNGKDALKAAGLSWSKDAKTGQWEICWWQQIDAATIERENAAIEASRATDANVEIPVPAGLAYLPFQRAGIASMMRMFGDLV